jgi:hypothetical protein
MLAEIFFILMTALSSMLKIGRAIPTVALTGMRSQPNKAALAKMHVLNTTL